MRAACAGGADRARRRGVAVPWALAAPRAAQRAGPRGPRDRRDAPRRGVARCGAAARRATRGARAHGDSEQPRDRAADRGRRAAGVDRRRRLDLDDARARWRRSRAREPARTRLADVSGARRAPRHDLRRAVRRDRDGRITRRPGDDARLGPRQRRRCGRARERWHGAVRRDVRRRRARFASPTARTRASRR